MPRGVAGDDIKFAVAVPIGHIGDDQRAAIQFRRFLQDCAGRLEDRFTPLAQSFRETLVVHPALTGRDQIGARAVGRWICGHIRADSRVANHAALRIGDMNFGR